MPDTYVGSGWSAPKRGVCRWCQITIYNKDGSPTTDRRRLWHVACADTYMTATNAGYARRKVWERDRGKCAACDAVATRLSEPDAVTGVWGRRTPVEAKWAVDHIVPLHTVDRNEEGALRFWLIDNMQTLCASCHKTKSAYEAAVRGKVQRIRDSDGLRKSKLSKKARWLARKKRHTHD